MIKLWTFLAALLCLSATPVCFADMITYTLEGRQAGSSGPPTDLGFFRYDPDLISSSTLDVLPSGTQRRVTSFQPAGFEFDLGPRGVSRTYWIYQYLAAGGVSSLSFGIEWDGGECHGGCFQRYSLGLNYESRGSALFGDLASPLSFVDLISATITYSELSWQVVDGEDHWSLYKDVKDITSTHVTAVPEGDRWALLAAGLLFATFRLHSRLKPAAAPRR